VAGRPFLEWVVRYLARQGLRNVLLSTGHLAHVVENHFRAQPVPGVVTRCIPETQPLGTAGGFLNAVHVSGDSPAAWLVLNGDSLVFGSLTEAARQLRGPSVSGVVVGCEVPDASRYGTLTLTPGGELQGFAEKRPGKGIINAGIYILRHSVVQEMHGNPPLSFEQDVFPQLIQRGAALRVFPVTPPFLDIGTPESLKQAEAFVEQNRTQFQ